MGDDGLWTRLPPELLTLVLNRMDAGTLFSVRSTCKGARRAVEDVLAPCVRGRSMVIRTLKQLSSVVDEDRSGRYEHVFGGVFHAWYFRTKLRSITFVDGPLVLGIAHPHPRPRGRWVRWCTACGGSLPCDHALEGGALQR